MNSKGLVLSGQQARSELDRRPGGGPSEPSNMMISTDKNLVPSAVARLQQQQQNQPGSANSNSNSNSINNNQEPVWPPKNPDSLREPPSGLMKVFDQDGLIMPRRIAHNPICQTGSQSAAIRDLNRELKFNQVRGKNVLDQKSELAKAMQKLQANRRKREAEQERLTRRTSLELRLEERAERIARECEANDSEGQQLKAPGDESLVTANDGACLVTTRGKAESEENCTIPTGGRQLPPNITIKTFQTR